LLGAADIAPFMPPMQDVGTRQFAAEAQNGGMSNVIRPALAARRAVIQQCVACPQAYR